MLDLFGDDFAELFATKSGTVVLRPDANAYIPLDRGAVYLWPAALSEEISIPSVKKSLAAVGPMIAGWPRPDGLQYARGSDPVEAFINALFLREENKDLGILPNFNFATRDSIAANLTDSLKGKSSSTQRATIARIQALLVEFKVLTVLLDSSGRRPMICCINYPFTTLHEPAAPVESAVVVKPAIDVPPPMELPDGASKDMSLKLLERQLTNRARPHSNIGADGSLMSEYKSSTVVRSFTQGKYALDLESVSHDKTAAVMDKRDDSAYELLLGWCTTWQANNYRRTARFEKTYVITARQLAELFGYKTWNRSIRKQVTAIVNRWCSTVTKTKGSVDPTSKNTDEFGDEILKFIVNQQFDQFDKPERFTNELADGSEELVSLRFKLPESAQSEVERKARGDFTDLEHRIGGKLDPSTYQRGPFINDTLFCALRSFFYNHVNYLNHGWRAELWQGLSDIFHFDFTVDSSLDRAQRKLAKDNINNTFRHYLFDFLKLFTDDLEKNKAIWSGIKGGTIVTNNNLPGIRLEITINPRKAPNNPKTGEVFLRKFAEPKVLGSAPPEDAPSHIRRAHAVGLTAVQAEGLVETFGVDEFARSLLSLEFRDDKLPPVQKPYLYIKRVLEAPKDSNGDSTLYDPDADWEGYSDDQVSPALNSDSDILDASFKVIEDQGRG